MGDMYITMQQDLTELVRLVREHERYCAAVMQDATNATDESRSRHVDRARRIDELSRRYGIKP